MQKEPQLAKLRFFYMSRKIPTLLYLLEIHISDVVVLVRTVAA